MASVALTEPVATRAPTRSKLCCWSTQDCWIRCCASWWVRRREPHPRRCEAPSWQWSLLVDAKRNQAPASSLVGDAALLVRNERFADFLLRAVATPLHSLHSFVLDVVLELAADRESARVLDDETEVAELLALQAASPDGLHNARLVLALCAVVGGDNARIRRMVATRHGVPHDDVTRHVGIALCEYVSVATRRVNLSWHVENALALLCLGCGRDAKVRAACISWDGVDVVLIQALARALAEESVVGVELALRAVRLVGNFPNPNPAPHSSSMVAVAVGRRWCVWRWSGWTSRSLHALPRRNVADSQKETWRRVRGEAQVVLGMLSLQSSC